MGWDPILVDLLERSTDESYRAKKGSRSHGRFERAPIEKPQALRGIPRTFSRYGIAPDKARSVLAACPRPAAVLVSGVMTYWYTGVQETVAMVREVLPDVPILLGGVYASLMPEHARRCSGADEVIPGPGEHNVAEALYRHTGVVREGTPDERPYELEPALDLLPHVRFLPLITSRGCPFKCSYCASRRLVPEFVRKPVDDVIREIKRARDCFDAHEIALYDDAFLVQPESHALPILRRTAEELPGMVWHAPNGLHAAPIDREVAHAMKASGFETIRIGFESSSDRFHDRTGGKTNKDAFLSAVLHLRDAGFDQEQIGAYILTGFPGQTRERLEADVEFVLRAGAHPKPAEYSPIPGTAAWPEAVAKSRFPIGNEPLFHNCTMLAAAEPGIDWAFLQKTRRKILEYLDSHARSAGVPDPQDTC